MNDTMPLPPGQKEREDFPRFGVTAFASFQAPVSATYTLLLAGDIESISICRNDLAGLERIEYVSDFHCVATWSHRGVSWSGFRFRDVFEQIVQPRIPSGISIALVAFRGLDGYRASLPLDDALADTVLIADTLNGEPLPSKHGAPLRLVAPAHYGYKNVKHLSKIELWRDGRSYRPIIPRIMEHPRARVAYEERGRILPGWLLRYIYRPLINRIIRQFERASRTSLT
jgi:DMSO/TMAO reductase YedYZ molybdopterin-dependent catalytic subunit